MNQKKKNRELNLAIIFIIIIIATGIYYGIYAEYERLFRLGLAIITVFGVYLLYRKSFLKGAKVIYYMNLIFIFLSMYLASGLNFYSIPNYDKFLHLLSGAVIAIIGYVLFLYLTTKKSRKEMNTLMPVVFVVIFATAVAGTWEIWEFTTDSIFGLKAQNGSLTDTMWDIICGTVVGIITSIPIYLHSKGKRIKFIDKIINDIEENR